jgi:solute carrier family 1 (high affinity glutamate transporter) protein 2
MAPASPKYDVIETPSIGGKDSYVPSPLKKHNKWKEWFFGIPGILTGAVLGIFIGWAIQTGNPSAELVSWIGVPGNLFIRAIKCLVTPLVFCSLIVGMADMLAVGKAGAIGWRTGLLYLTTTVIATCEGLIWVLIFRPYFGNKKKETDAAVAEMAFECDKSGYFLTEANGTLSCVYDAAYNATETVSDAAKFVAKDLNGYFSTSSSGFAKRTLTQALQGQLDAMVPSNITLAFSEATLLSIIMFSVPFGIAISLLPRDAKVVGNFFREINMVFMTMIVWVIKCTPIAIISLLASSIAEQDDLKSIVSDVGIFVLCDLLALFGHCYIFYPLLLRAFVRCNPFAWLKKMVRAQLFAFGCASSMATLPIVMECIDATNAISKTLSRFVLSLGATIGMDGAAIGYPIAIIFMAEAEGLGHIVGGVEYFLVILVSTIGAVGSGPVPAAGIVMTMTIWTSVFPSVPLPSTFAFIVATDWFLDRFQTAVNVTCDTIVCRIVAEQVGETLDAELRDNLASAVDGMLSHNPELKDAIETPRNHA